jgi:hypothetical protein
MKQSAMQDLREDLMLTVDSTKEALLEIENVAIRTACQEVVRLTLKNIIKRIDDELLEMEKEQIINAYKEGVNGTKLAEQYYNEKFKNK